MTESTYRCLYGLQTGLVTPFLGSFHMITVIPSFSRVVLRGFANLRGRYKNKK